MFETIFMLCKLFRTRKGQYLSCSVKVASNSEWRVMNGNTNTTSVLMAGQQAISTFVEH